MGPMECPHCGALVPSRRICCASCGSDLETGWKDAQEIDYSSYPMRNLLLKQLPKSTRQRLDPWESC